MERGQRRNNKKKHGNKANFLMIQMLEVEFYFIFFSYKEGNNNVNKIYPVIMK